MTYTRPFSQTAFPTTSGLLLCLVGLCPASEAQVLLAESFDDDTQYVTSIIEQTDGSRDFFGRIPPLSTAPTAYDVTGFDGPFFGAQDFPGLSVNRQQTLTFDAVDVSGTPGVELAIVLAEDDVAGGGESWDNPDYFHVDYALDGEDFLPLLYVEAAGGTNTAPRIDDDFDGLGEGTEITSAAQQFTRRLATGNAGSLVIRLTFDLNAGEEDIAVDDITLSASSAPLPVALLSFEADATGRDVALAWTTASERDNAFFAVEQSSDGASFSEIGRVDGAGTVETATAYGFEAAALPAGQHYFRLAQVDFDGATTHSEVISAAVSLDGGGITELALDRDDLSFTSVAAGDFRILDVRGATVSSFRAEAGRTTVSLADLPAAAYVLTDGRHSVRFVR